MPNDAFTPGSDALLLDDPIARAKVENPFDPPDLTSNGVVLPDLQDDDANAQAAAVVLAELSEDEDTDGEPGDVDDDSEVADPDDDTPIEEI